jgi:hypothetical protein
LFDFQITTQIDEIVTKHVFMLRASTLVNAVNKAMVLIDNQTPDAIFIGLTYHHPPLERNR